MEEPGTGDRSHVDLERPDAYGRSFADVYDRWYTEVTDAAATARFVADRCRRGPVLELGVGSGRLAVPMAECGLPVIGLDASMAMLSRCRRPRPGSAPLHLVAGDMAALPFPASQLQIGAAVIAFNTIFNLASRPLQARLLAQVRSLLADGGPLIVEALDVSPLLSGPRRSIGAREVTTDGVVVTATQLDRRDQVLTGQHLEVGHDGVTVRPWRLSWLTPDQLDDLANRAGLTLTERYGSWDQAPFTDHSQSHISVYRPADAP